MEDMNALEQLCKNLFPWIVRIYELSSDTEQPLYYDEDDNDLQLKE